MGTEKITHKMLLDNYRSLCRDGTTLISTINGQDVRWSYRRDHRDGLYCSVCKPGDADTITLEYDRTGYIDFDADADAGANQKISDDMDAVLGNRIIN